MKRFLSRNIVPLIFSLSAIAVFLTSIFTATTIDFAANELEYNTEKRLIALAQIAATLVSAEELDLFWDPDQMETPEYIEIKQRLDDFAVASEVLYAYYLRPVPGNESYVQFVVDNVMDFDDMDGLLSDPVEIEPAPLAAMEGRAACAGLGVYSVDWEGFLAAYAPVYDKDGNIYCIAGVDMPDTHIVKARDNAKTLSSTMFITMVLVMITGFFTFYIYRRKAIQAESASNTKSLFLSSMSHEIRTPMNAIVGFTRMAKAASQTQEKDQYLESIELASNHLLTLINDILDISKIESGKMNINEINVDFVSRIDATLGLIRSQAEAKRQRLTLIYDEKIPRYIICDPTHLNQVLVNLLSNAIKFSPVGGSITMEIRLIEEGGGRCNLFFSVRDNGIGIDKDGQKRIFEIFEQADAGTTRKYGGTGLGLAISQQLIELMGGKIKLTSVPGKGSDFYFDLWFRTADRGEEIDEISAIDLSGKHILLVEDSEINRIVAEDVFASLGATNDHAPNGRVGVEMFVAAPHKYDAIFMDIQMPILDGYSATKEIRALAVPQAKTVPIIAMTANVFKEDVERAMASGMDAHLGKPFDVDDMVVATSKAFAARQK